MGDEPANFSPHQPSAKGGCELTHPSAKSRPPACRPERQGRRPPDEEKPRIPPGLSVLPTYPPDPHRD